MIDPATLTKDELIKNLWLTDEIINEIDIIKDEIEKKNKSLELTITSTEQEYLKTIEDSYMKSTLYQKHIKYNDLLEHMKSFKGIAVLLDLIICVSLGYLFIIQGIQLMYVILFWIIAPIVLYLIYDKSVGYYLKSKKPSPLPTLEQTIEEAKNSDEYSNIPNSLVAKHIRQEIVQFQQNIQQLEESLDEKSVLPIIYRLRAKEIIWYLENLRADNLKEALAALVDSDHRKQMKEMVEQQNHEIERLNKITERLLKDNNQLKQQIERQHEQIIQLNNRKK